MDLSKTKPKSNKASDVKANKLKKLAILTSFLQKLARGTQQKGVIDSCVSLLSRNFIDGDLISRNISSFML
jgi:hypothetical protein